MARTERGRRWLARFALIGLLAVAWANSLTNHFAWDDGQNIVQNEHIDDWSHVPQLFRQMWRPLKRLTFMIDYALYGKRPYGYHVTNLLFHAAATLALHALALRLGASPRLAFAAAALFGVHPVQVESVANISDRKEMMTTLFSLLAFMAYLRLGPALARLKQPAIERGAVRPPLAALGWLTAVAAAYAAALLSKETSILLPAAIVTWELCYEPARAEPARRRRAVWLGVCCALLAAAFVVAGGFLKLGEYFSEARIRWISQNSVTRYPALVGNSLRAYASDLGLLVWPEPLTLRHQLAFSTSLADWRVLAAAVVIALHVVLIVLLRRRAPIASFGLAWTGIQLLPVVNLVPLTWWFVAERFLYLPSAGFCLAAAHLFDLRLPGRPERAATSGGSLWRGAQALLLAFVIGAAVARTVERNRDWTTSATIVLAGVDREPDNFFLLYWLSSIQQERGDLDAAIATARRAIELNPGYHSAHFILGQYLLAKGQLGEARARLERAIELNPFAKREWIVMARIESELGDLPAALRALEQARQAGSDSRSASGLEGEILLRLGRTAEAAAVAAALTSEHPDFGPGLVLEARVLERQGRFDAAAGRYAAALEAGVVDFETLMDAAHASALAGDIETAKALARRARELVKTPVGRARAEALLDELLALASAPPPD